MTVEEDADADGPARIVEAPPSGPAELASGALWDVADERAAPAERAAARKARVAKPVHADVLDWISDLPTPETDRAPASDGEAPARPVEAQEADAGDVWGEAAQVEPFETGPATATDEAEAVAAADLAEPVAAEEAMRRWRSR